MRTLIQVIVASFMLVSVCAHADQEAALIELAPILITAPELTADEIQAATKEEEAEEAQLNLVEAQVGVDPTHE
ncbi:hypothetical protein [Pseudomonas sp. CFBP 13719]|uniref:hypothetical protein n=1 Tax=Pseudomonas sp. CFBP 13719 TaxID=2775303 RepID=UPI001780E2E1|nr:hypothetical protein [Pseudomonas sp. CFBP 13719]MBD8614941.1 hypothetical protein [Pseudomonas putida]MBD8681374.1 hypothetical protein [Pseudomonas sp. CFBP 13719]